MKINESKEKLPVSFLTDFVSKGWEEVGYLKADIEAIKEAYSGTGKIEELIQGLIDAYLVCIGQMELHLNDKKYLDYPEESGLGDTKENLKEGIELSIEGDKVEISTDPETAVTVDPEGDKIILDNSEVSTTEIPAAEADIPAVVEPAEEPIAADNGEFNTPFEFDTPEAEGVRKFEKPEVADFFVDFDDPVGEPVTEKDLYGEGEEPIEGEKIDDNIEEK